MLLLSRLGVGTAPWLASAYMLVVGVGIGLVMQVLVLVVQNDAAPKDMGVATSTATFFRSMGGFVRGRDLRRHLQRTPRRPDPSASPDIGRQLVGGVHLTPEQVKHLPTRRSTMHSSTPCAFAARRLPLGDADHGHPLRPLLDAEGGAVRATLHGTEHRGRRRAATIYLLAGEELVWDVVISEATILHADLDAFYASVSNATMRRSRQARHRRARRRARREL